MAKIKKSGIVFLSLLFISSVSMGALLGWALSETKNIENSEYISEFDTALPTKLLDINGELITEFASDEKREIISFQQLPQHLIDALITREDRIFFSHKGFSVKAVMRAIFGKLTGKSLGGGSTLTQQIAGTLYCDRTDMSYTRKIKELWWAIQMERRYSKNEILELYLNKIYFGGGTYGVNAASKYYFGHGATEITPAEAAILVIQLSNPAFYNPFDHPNRAMDRQKDVLSAMVSNGYITQEQSDQSFDNYWDSFDFTRTSTSAYMMRDDKAPWFSEYVRRELGNMIYGSDDIYTSGFTVNTTLNLQHQQIAQSVMEKYIDIANTRYKNEHSSKSDIAFNTYVPLTEMLSLLFDIPSLKMSEKRAEQVANNTYISQINPILDVLSLITGQDKLKVNVINRATAIAKQEDEKTTIEGTMIALNHENGYIDALVGGSKFDSDNQFIRATQAKVQPGSTFKPLYYSAAIDSKKYTPTTQISDTPVVFHTADGKPYIPLNFKGEWEGDVSLWRALTRSMNVPSLKILDGIGFEAAIDRAVALLGIPKNEIASRAFVPGYPIGLGVCSVRPVEMARAYAIFANGGKEITPMAIRTVEDKNGNVILNPELDIRKEQAAKGEKIQVISPQTAFVMTKLLEQTVNNGGTLAAQAWHFNYRDENKNRYTMPAAGKTGTTQNWADAWTCGFTPYYAAAFWFGFDKPGQSLGLNITGATLAGYAWGEYFDKIHENLPLKDWNKPLEGVIECTVCSESGQILTEACGDNKTTQWYLKGTEPTEICPIHSSTSSSTMAINRLEREMMKTGLKLDFDFERKPLKLNLDFLDGDYSFESASDSLEEKIDDMEANLVDMNIDYDYNYLMD
ncbi:MAG: PBP1A family penicillin-binding protein [Spirochaetales bacterium]|nr:PBP1A family penicillin-binding protein [Spirochaetales bacterium]MDY5915029.1 PBP1A family penicillin-binding protein [Treponema sp.]